ncbi:hypothetical protein MSAN_01948200 [Mycena sanguinolenta]|uniref:DUF6699 domain-containing protein n=1 Tax=Mycena sanguinolenta TaxID=230812 RepID=A0A8H6XL60_9AGAR|nr:hypothetical protein MSAN_01948200 [Mycena sanguinolenta]
MGWLGLRKCCRSTKSSSYSLRPPFLWFGKNPRRPVPPQATMWPWTPHPNLPISNRVMPPPSPFADDGLPPLVPCPPPPPFGQPIPMQPPVWSSELNPELSTPRGTHPFIDWDITQFPSSARLHESSDSQTDPTFTSPAIFPPTELITISYGDTPILSFWENRWGPIFALGQGGHPVTLEDVLNAIYRYFDQPLTTEDQAMMSNHTWGVVCDAYHRRCDRPPNLRAYNVTRGPLRVDVLNGATKFSGLEMVIHAYLRLFLSPR